MKKQRHIKELHKKYDTSISYYTECLSIVADNRKLDDDAVFSMLPYVGYIKFESRHDIPLWDDTNLDWITGKVLEVDKENTMVVVATIDDHNGGIVIVKRDYSNLIMHGNVAKVKEEYNENINIF